MSLLLLLATSLAADLVVGTDAFPTVQAAADAAQDGDCVVIPAVGATGPVHIEGTQNLRIRGESPGVTLRCPELPCVTAHDADGLTVFDLELRRAPSLEDGALVSIADSERVTLLRLSAQGVLLDTADSAVWVRESWLVSRDGAPSPFATAPNAVEGSALIGWTAANQTVTGVPIAPFTNNTIIPERFDATEVTTFTAGQEHNLLFALGPMRSEGTNRIGNPHFVDLAGLDLRLTPASLVPQDFGVALVGKYATLAPHTTDLTVDDVLFSTEPATRVGPHEVSVIGESDDGVVAVRIRDAEGNKPIRLVIVDLSTNQALATAPPEVIQGSPQSSLAYLRDIGPAYYDALTTAAEHGVRRGVSAGTDVAPGALDTVVLQMLAGHRVALRADAEDGTLTPIALPPHDVAIPPTTEEVRARWTDRLLTVATTPPTPVAAYTSRSDNPPDATVFPLGWSQDGVLMLLDTRLDVEDQTLPRIRFTDTTTGRHLDWREPPQPAGPLSDVAASHYAGAFDMAEWLGVEPVDGDFEWLFLNIEPHWSTPSHTVLSWEIDYDEQRTWATIVPPLACRPEDVAPADCPPEATVPPRQAVGLLFRSPDWAHHAVVYADAEDLTNEGPYVVPPLPFDPPPTNPLPLVSPLHGRADRLATVAPLAQDVVVLCDDHTLRPLGPLVGTEPVREYLSRYTQHNYALPCAAQWAFGRSLPGLTATGSIPVYDPSFDAESNGGEVLDLSLGDSVLHVELLPHHERRCTLKRGPHSFTIDATTRCEPSFAGDLNGDGHADIIVNTGHPLCYGSQVLFSNAHGWSVVAREEWCD